MAALLQVVAEGAARAAALAVRGADAAQTAREAVHAHGRDVRAPPERCFYYRMYKTPFTIIMVDFYYTRVEQRRLPAACMRFWTFRTAVGPVACRNGGPKSEKVVFDGLVGPRSPAGASLRKMSAP